MYSSVTRKNLHPTPFPEFNYSLLNKSQHGFTSKRSCVTNLLEFCDDVTGILDEGDPVDIVYLDFQKAFDKVPHKRLGCKLATHGIDGNIRKLK